MGSDDSIVDCPVIYDVYGSEDVGSARPSVDMSLTAAFQKEGGNFHKVELEEEDDCRPGANDGQNPDGDSSTGVMTEISAVIYAVDLATVYGPTLPQNVQIPARRILCRRRRIRRLRIRPRPIRPR